MSDATAPSSTSLCSQGDELSRVEKQSPRRPLVDHAEPDDPVRVGIRKRIQEHRVDDAEQSRRRGDAGRQRQHCRRDEAGTSAEGAQRMANIVDQEIEHGKSSIGAMRFQRWCDPAQPDEGVSARRIGRQTGEEIVVDVQLDVTVELASELAVSPPRIAAEGSGAVRPGSDGSHQEPFRPCALIRAPENRVASPEVP